MILVTVGISKFHFKRLIQKMDLLAIRIDEEVIAQIGSTKYQPKNMNYFDYTNEEEIIKLFFKSRIIVTHAGAGTLLNILKYNKPLVIVPRLKKYKECIDNHQLELAQILDNKKNIITVYDISNLELALKKADKLTSSKEVSKSKLVFFLKEYIEKMKK